MGDTGGCWSRVPWGYPGGVPGRCPGFQTGPARRVGGRSPPPAPEPTNQNTHYELASAAVSFFFLPFHLDCLAEYLVGGLGSRGGPTGRADSALLPTPQASTQGFLARSVCLSLLSSWFLFFVPRPTALCHGKFL